MADLLLSQANALIVDEQYDEARAVFDKAVAAAAAENSPNLGQCYLYRSANHIKLKNYPDALADADSCLKLLPDNATAHLRKGIALFYTDKFAAAKAAFEQAAKFGNSTTSLWIRKCDAELDLAAEESESKAASAAPVALQDAPAPEPAPVKVRESMYQNPNQVFVTLFVKGLARDKVTAEFGARSLDVQLALPDGSSFSKHWDLFAPILPADCSVNVTAFKVEVALKKAEPQDWDTLEAKAVEAVKRSNVHDGRIQAYPTSSAKGRDVNWEDLERKAEKEEEEEPASGDAGLQRLFQKIFKDADEDTRRAMVKSYQTSGGTVLSTNWKEVASKDYEKERQAPKGMEFVDPKK